VASTIPEPFALENQPAKKSLVQPIIKESDNAPDGSGFCCMRVNGVRLFVFQHRKIFRKATMSCDESSRLICSIKTGSTAFYAAK